MRFTKPFAASTLAIIFAASAYATDVSYGDPVRLFGFAESYSIKNSLTNVTITGKVKTPDGRPIRAALVTLKDADTNALVRSTYSSNFGYYKLEQVEAGRLYVLSVAHKRYLFALPAQLLEINEDRAGVDFTGEASDQD